MNKQDFLALAGDRLTAAVIREQGFALVPINPDGTLADEAFKQYIAAGAPDGRFFGAFLLVPPEEMERRRRMKPAAARFDPISGEPETTGSIAAWDALSPITVQGGASVSAADLSAYAASKGLLSSEITSTLARMLLPKGTAPIGPPEVLEQAALEWPYDPQAAQIAAERRAGLDRVAIQATPLPTSSVAPTLMRSAARTKWARLEDFLLSAFDTGELSRFLYSRGLVDRFAMPSGPISPAAFASAAVTQIRGRGAADGTFFDALLLERPRRGTEITDLRAEFGC